MAHWCMTFEPFQTGPSILLHNLLDTVVCWGRLQPAPTGSCSDWHPSSQLHMVSDTIPVGPNQPWWECLQCRNWQTGSLWIIPPHSIRWHCLVQAITGVCLGYCNPFLTGPVDFCIWLYNLSLTQTQDSTPYNRAWYIQCCFSISPFSKEWSPKHSRSFPVPWTQHYVPAHLHLWTSLVFP